MSREIKFRAWDVLYKKYHHNVGLTHPYGEEKRETLFVCFQEYLLSTTTFIVEQYTGLKDKNGKEIYEGDIIKDHMWCEIFIGVVVWDETQLGYAYEVIINGRKETYSLRHCAIEVIGNIHENEELLEREA